MFFYYALLTIEQSGILSSLGRGITKNKALLDEKTLLTEVITALTV